MNHELIVTADCIVITQAGLIKHMTLVNPSESTLRRLQGCSEWKSCDVVTLVDVKADGTQSFLKLENHWFIDVVRADSVVNVWLVRFVSRESLKVETNVQEQV